MRRDPKLRDLSSDHHQGLVLARQIGRAFEGGVATAQLVEEVQSRYEVELLPHFEIEETFLLPALASAGFNELVQRTLSDHEALRSDLDAARQGHLDRLRMFGERLRTHIRFEEHELFPACEEHLAPEVLEATAARTRRQASGR